MRDAQAKPSGNDDRVRAMSQSDVPGDAAERETEPIERHHRQTVAGRQSRSPQSGIVGDANVAALDHGKRFINVGQAWPGDDPLGRDPAKALTQPRENRILELVDRREVCVAAFAFDDVSMIAVTKHLSDAEPRAATDDADEALLR